MRETSGGPSVGLVTPTAGDAWLGGHYVVQSLYLATRPFLPFRDVWWGGAPSADPWADVRELLGPPLVVGMPTGVLARARRKVRRLAGGRDTGDIFRGAGVDVLYPVSPVPDPGVPLLFFVPDFQHRHLLHANDETTRAAFDGYFRAQGAVASRIHVTSESVMRDLRQFMPELAEKTRVVFPCSVATPAWTARDPRAVIREYGIPDRYFVVSNQVSAHKNHRTIVHALRLLRDRGVETTVVCTGRRADYRDPASFPRLEAEIAAHGLTARMLFLGVVPRADQMAIMRGAIAVVQPSEFEGWGAAVAEAKTLGKPLIASDLPVHHEHHHPRATFVQTLDVEGWAKAMSEAEAGLPAGPSAADEEAARERNALDASAAGRGFAALLTDAAAAR